MSGTPVVAVRDMLVAVSVRVNVTPTTTARLSSRSLCR